jgi:hypothetical protein
MLLSCIATHILSNNALYYPKFSGYTKGELWFDSRQVIGLRDNEYLLYPADQSCDTTGQDTNATGQFNGSIIQTRARVELSAPPLYNITSKGIIEADFFGTSVTLPVCRPRHAYATLSSNHVTVLAGHTWQPLFIEDCYPDTIGFNTGAPIEVFARQSQLRCGIDYHGLQIFGAALGQLETTSFGPIGASTQYLRNSMIPNMHLQAAYRLKKGRFQGSLVGAAIDFLRIVPRLVTNDNVYAQESVNATRCIAFGKFKYKSVDIKFKGLYIENGYDLVMLGGYGVTHIDPITDQRTYRPTRTISVWGEFSIKKQIEPGIFVGWTKNLGTKEVIIPTYNSENLLYTRNSNIDTVIRIAPRVRCYVKPCIIAFETEYTRATYGIVNNHARPYNTHPELNIRLLGSVYYTF